MKMKRRKVEVFVPGCRLNRAWKMWLRFQSSTELLLFCCFLIQFLTSPLRLTANLGKGLAEIQRGFQAANPRRNSRQSREEKSKNLNQELSILILKHFSERWHAVETQTKQRHFLPKFLVVEVPGNVRGLRRLLPPAVVSLHLRWRQIRRLSVTHCLHANPSKRFSIELRDWNALIKGSWRAKENWRDDEWWSLAETKTEQADKQKVEHTHTHTHTDFRSL